MMVARPDYANVQELEADVAYAAHLMLRYGDYIAPIFERLERELEIMKRKGSPRQRAEAFLARHEDEVPDV